MMRHALMDYFQLVNMFNINVYVYNDSILFHFLIFCIMSSLHKQEVDVKNQ